MLARQMLLLHALLSAVHQPETNVALLLRPLCFQRCLLSAYTSTYIRCSRHFSIVAIALVIKKCGEAINQS